MMHLPKIGVLRWVQPPPPKSSGPKMAQKLVLVLDGCRGVAILPKCKQASWWWLVGEITVDGVEMPKGTPLFTDVHGRVLCCNRPYRIVYFDVFDHTKISRSGKQQVYSMLSCCGNCILSLRRSVIHKPQKIMVFHMKSVNLEVIVCTTLL